MQPANSPEREACVGRVRPRAAARLCRTADNASVGWQYVTEEVRLWVISGRSFATSPLGAAPA